MAYAAMAAAIPTSKVAAQVVYHDLDPDLMVENIYCFGCTDIEYIDMDMDGNDDFGIAMFYDYGLSGYLPTHSAYLMALGSNKVAYMVSSSSVWNYDIGDYVIMTETVAQKLTFGDVVDDTYTFATLNAVIRSYIEGFDEFDSPTFGQWGTNTVAYAGVELMIDGDLHYGWIQLQHAHPGFDWQLIALDYAYNTIPGESLIAGAIPVTCDAPAYAYEITTPTAVKIFFTAEEEPFQYTIRYRVAGAVGSWTNQNKATPQFKLKDLDCDQTYEYQVRSICDEDGVTISSPWSPLQYITSGSCRIGALVDELMVYPVPAQTSVTLQANTTILRLQVYQMDGKQVKDVQPMEQEVVLELNDIAPGMYMLIITTETGIETRELFVQR